MKKVAIVGVEGSGKTVLMAAMGDKYKSPDCNGVFLKPLNRETYAYYTRTVAQLRDGAWPMATENNVLDLSWGLMRQEGKRPEPKQLGELSFIDFGGEIYRRAFGDRSESDLADENEERKKAVVTLRDHVKAADVVIVLVNLSDIINGNGTDERTIEMSWLSQAILTYAYEKAQKTNVALVFTQTDSYAETIRQCGGVSGTLARYLSEVHASYGNRLALLGVSAVNKTRLTDGALVPASDFNSDGFDDLMGWMVDGIAPSRKRKNLGCLTAMALILSVCAGIVSYNNDTQFRKRVQALVGMEEAVVPPKSPTSSVTNRVVSLPTTTKPELPKPQPKPVVKPEPPPKPKWIPGKRNLNNPNLIAGSAEGTWLSTRAGYAWVQGTDRDEWTPGMKHSSNSGLIVGQLEGTWRATTPGYFWIGGDKTEWRANTPHPQFSHVVSAAEEGMWRPEPGYVWVDPNKTGVREVKWEPGRIENGRKTGTTPGSWLKKCFACDGNGSRKCTKCSGTGRISCSSCGGDGKNSVSKEDRCYKCGGTGRMEVECPEYDCEVLYNYNHLYGGKHVRRCGVCAGTGVYGWIPCTACRGLGCSLCDTCKGRNKVKEECDKCDGDGYRTRWVNERCSRCSGNGKTYCPQSDCRNGNINCSLCDGTGWRAE